MSNRRLTPSQALLYVTIALLLTFRFASQTHTQAQEPGFFKIESGLTYEEGQQANLFFFRWKDRQARMDYNPQIFQIGDAKNIHYVFHL